MIEPAVKIALETYCEIYFFFFGKRMKTSCMLT